MLITLRVRNWRRHKESNLACLPYQGSTLTLGHTCMEPCEGIGPSKNDYKSLFAPKRTGLEMVAQMGLAPMSDSL